MRSTRRVLVTWLAFALPVLILAAVLWHGPRAATAQQKFVWKVQSAWPASNLLHLSAVELAKMIEEMSAGRLKWEMLPAGAVVGSFEVLDAVNRGLIDASHAWPVAGPNRSRRASPILPSSGRRAGLSACPDTDRTVGSPVSA